MNNVSGCPVSIHYVQNNCSTNLSSSISRLDSDSESVRHRASRRSISSCNLRCRRRFSSLTCLSSCAYRAIFSSSERIINFLAVNCDFLFSFFERKNPQRLNTAKVHIVMTIIPINSYSSISRRLHKDTNFTI